jgi:methionyl-tRNA formyltransferase
MLPRKSPVHVFAERAGLSVITPADLKPGEVQGAFEALGAHVAVVAAYGLILPKAILASPVHGCLNLHASALPRWRGAAPIQRAIMAGDTETAATVMRMDEGLDTGPVCLAEPIEIAPDMTAGELHDEIATRGSRLVVRALAGLERGELDCMPQAASGVTYASKIGKAEGRIDFMRPAGDVHNLVRGLSPMPGAWFEAGPVGRRERIKVLRSTIAAGSGPPGSVLDATTLTVACGEDAVRLLEVQRAGKRPVGAAEFLRGFAPGARF